MPKVTERVSEGMMIQRQDTGIHSVFMSLRGHASARLLGKNNELNRILYNLEVKVGGVCL